MRSVSEKHSYLARCNPLSNVAIPESHEVLLVEREMRKERSELEGLENRSFSSPGQLETMGHYGV